MTSPTSAGLPYSETQRREAVDWFVEIHADDTPSTESLQAWMRWMDQDDANRVAFESVIQAWHATPKSMTLPSAEELLSDTYDGELSVTEWLATQSAMGGLAAGAAVQSARQRTHRRWAWLAAASLVAITLGPFAMNKYFDLHSPHADVFTTRTGELLEITLADGSHVWLGPQSRLVVGFTKQRRGIQLTSGEAFFSVKKDRTRPFTVNSASGDITAVGTAFNVRAVAGVVTVAVSEGVVTIAPKQQVVTATPAIVRVASGQQVTFTAQESVKALAIIQTPSLGERARWREGVLVYRDEPLRTVVMDVARYFNKQLEISDDTVGSLHYSGVVYKDAIEEWTSALPESFPIKIVTEGNREIITAR